MIKPNAIFGLNLLRMRSMLGMTQAELAKRAKMSAAAICQIESGQREPGLSTILKILAIIPCTFEKLMTENPDTYITHVKIPGRRKND